MDMVALGRKLGSFRSKMRREQRRLLLPVIGMTALGVALVMARGKPSLIPVVFASTLAMYLVPRVLVAIMARAWTVHVHELGIVARDVFGFRRAVRWEHVRYVRYAFHGVPESLVIETDPPVRRRYIPWPLEDAERFAELVRDAAGADHPLSEMTQGELALHRGRPYSRLGNMRSPDQ